MALKMLTIDLQIQKYCNSLLYCTVLYCPVLSCPVLSCPVLSCPVLSCPVLSCTVQYSTLVQYSTVKIVELIFERLLSKGCIRKNVGEPYIHCLFALKFMLNYLKID